MTFERTMLPLYISFILGTAALACGLVAYGYIEVLRYVVCLFFFGGATLSFMGYRRYTPPGETEPALLTLLKLKSLIFAVVGFAFLLSATRSDQAPVDSTSLALLLTFAAFTAAGAAMFFTGLYVFIGANRGWISREIYKHPWRRGTGGD